MSSISRLNNPSTPRFSPVDSADATRKPSAPQRMSEPSKDNSLKDLFSADSFEPGKAGGTGQALEKALEGVTKLLGELTKLLGGQGGAAPGGSAGTDSMPGGEQVPELGDDPGMRAQAPESPEAAQPQAAASPAQQTQAAPASGETQPVQGVGAKSAADASGGAGKTDAQQFLGKGLYPKDQVYEEISHDAPGLGEKNKALWDTAHQRGASDAEAAILVAQQMQEGGNDPSKSGGAENFGPLNLNRGLLKDFGGVKEEDLSKLNDNSNGKYTQEALNANVDAALTAMKTIGTQRYLDHTRGGGSGFEHPTERLPFAGPKTADDDTRRFGRNISNTANRLLEQVQKDPSSISRDWRQAANIPYV